MPTRLATKPKCLELLLLEIYACQGLCEWTKLEEQLGRIIEQLEERIAQPLIPSNQTINHYHHSV